MPLNDEHLWKYLINQDIYIVQEFGIGIVGIGALMWAYGTVNSPFLQQIIAWVGLGGSLILWMHIFGAGKEFLFLKNALQKENPDFIKRFDEARSWRGKGRYRYLYWPPTRLMTYFMGLVSWTWSALILSHYAIHHNILVILSIGILGFALVLTLLRRLEDLGDP